MTVRLLLAAIQLQQVFNDGFSLRRLRRPVVVALAAGNATPAAN